MPGRIITLMKKKVNTSDFGVHVVVEIAIPLLALVIDDCCIFNFKKDNSMSFLPRVSWSIKYCYEEG